MSLAALAAAVVAAAAVAVVVLFWANYYCRCCCSTAAPSSSSPLELVTLCKAPAEGQKGRKSARLLAAVGSRPAECGKENKGIE